MSLPPLQDITMFHCHYLLVIMLLPSDVIDKEPYFGRIGCNLFLTVSMMLGQFCPTCLLCDGMFNNYATLN